MARLIGEHYEGDVRVRWTHDDTTDQVHVERAQDIQAVIDQVAAENADGMPIIDGMISAAFRGTSSSTPMITRMNGVS